jgi:hypothetical protein
LPGLDLLPGEALRQVQLQMRAITFVTGTSTPAPVYPFNLLVGIGFGLDSSTPPDFDPDVNAPGWDWLAVRAGVNAVHGRPTTTANNGWQLEMATSAEGWIPCPRPPVTETTSIWLVTNSLPPPAAGGVDWEADAFLSYRTFM